MKTVRILAGFAITIVLAFPLCLPGISRAEKSDFVSPPPIVLNAEKSALVGGQPVREVLVTEDPIYAFDPEHKPSPDFMMYVPVPPGFIDVATYTDESFPDWLKGHPETRPSELHIVMPADPKAGLYPEFSVLTLTIRPYPPNGRRIEYEKLGTFPTCPGKSDNVKTLSAEKLAFLQGADTGFSTKEWLELIEEERSLDYFFDDGTAYWLEAPKRDGHIDTMKAEAYKQSLESKLGPILQELRKEMPEEVVAELENARKLAVIEGRTIDEEAFLNDALTLYALREGLVELATGTPDIRSSHQAARVEGCLHLKDSYLNVSMRVGPAEGPEALRTAYKVLSAFTKDFITLNK